MKHQSYILCIESASDSCSLALFRGGELLAERSSFDSTKHNANLSLFASELLELIPKSNKLSAIAVVDGPGSYTGLRISASLAKGIAFARSLPLISVPSLTIIAYSMLERLTENLIEDTILIPTLDARRFEVYASKMKVTAEHTLELLNQVDSYEMSSDRDVARLENVLGVHPFYYGGNGAKKIKSKMISLFGDRAIFLAGASLSARHMIVPALESLEKKQFVDLAYWAPNYIKKYKAVVSKNKVIGTTPNSL